jgi:hypothetical protein
MYLVNKPILNYGIANLLKQLIQGLHFIQRNCTQEVISN